MVRRWWISAITTHSSKSGCEWRGILPGQRTPSRSLTDPGAHKIHLQVISHRRRRAQAKGNFNCSQNCTYSPLTIVLVHLQPVLLHSSVIVVDLLWWSMRSGRRQRRSRWQDLCKGQTWKFIRYIYTWEHRLLFWFGQRLLFSQRMSEWAMGGGNVWSGDSAESPFVGHLTTHPPPPRRRPRWKKGLLNALPLLIPSSFCTFVIHPLILYLFLAIFPCNPLMANHLLHTKTPPPSQSHHIAAAWMEQRLWRFSRP